MNAMALSLVLILAAAAAAQAGPVRPPGAVGAPGALHAPALGPRVDPLAEQRARQRAAQLDRQRAQVELLRRQRELDRVSAQSAQRSLDLRRATTAEPLVADRLQREAAAHERARQLQRAQRSQALQGELDAAYRLPPVGERDRLQWRARLPEP